jgi:DNA-binding MltR family transcriptional regulator
MKPHELDLYDYSDLVTLFHSESDRGAAVLAGSYVENYLATLLKAWMENTDKADQLFDSSGPLSSFSQRIEIAYAFGIIYLHDYKDLQNIRKIRNYFAHHPKEASFNNSPVREWVANLSMNETLKQAAQQTGMNINLEDKRFIYLSATGMFVVNATNSITQRTKEA